MTDPTLFVPVAKVATWLGLDPDALTNLQISVIADSILDAQAKVAAFLMRRLEPTTVTLTELVRDNLWDADDIRAWPEARGQMNDTYTVSAAVANTTDSTVWDVTFTVGLDVANDPDLDPIRRFVRQDAISALAELPMFAHLIPRRVQSVTAEGQSVSYDKRLRAPSPDAAGTDMGLSSLRRWRRYAVGRATEPIDQRPYPYRG